MTTPRREATVQALSRVALDHVGVLVDAVMPVLVAAQPPGFHDAESLADLNLSAHDGLRSLLTVLSGTAAAEADPLDVPRTNGRRQAQQALDLEGVLLAYRFAGQAIWDHLVALARTSGEPLGDSLLDGAGEIWRVIDLFSVAATDAFRSEQVQLREHDERAATAVLVSLLDGRGSDPAFAREAAHTLGVSSGGPFVCVVALTDAPDALALDNPREPLTDAGMPSVWATMAGLEVGLVVVGAQGSEPVRQLLGPAVCGRAGMSPAFAELADLPRARRLAETAARCPGPARELRVLEEHVTAGLMIDAPLVASMLYERTIGALLAGSGADGPALLESLRVFLDTDGSVNTAAANNHVHRSTMLHRLTKIEKITGVGVRSLNDQVLWMLAFLEQDNRDAW